jgi:hypothetical protein
MTTIAEAAENFYLSVLRENDDVAKAQELKELFLTSLGKTEEPLTFQQVNARIQLWFSRITTHRYNKECHCMLCDCIESTAIDRISYMKDGKVFFMITLCPDVIRRSWFTTCMNHVTTI